MADKRILVILPSKGRPDKWKEAVESWRNTNSGHSTVLGVVPEPWKKDYEHFEDAGIMEDHFQSGVVKAINAAFLAHPNFAAYMFASDDMRFRTAGWDKTFLDKLEELDNTGVVYGNDLIHGEGIPTHWCVSGRLVKAFGYFGVPCCNHICADVFWKDVGDLIGRRSYLPEIITEHLHFSVNKAEYDWVYDSNNSSNRYHSDANAYKAFAEHVLPHEIIRITRELGWEVQQASSTPE